MRETIGLAKSYMQGGQRWCFVEDIRTEGPWRDVRMSPGAGAQELSQRRSRVLGLFNKLADGVTCSRSRQDVVGVARKGLGEVRLTFSLSGNA